MRKLQLLTAMAVGISATAIGAIQVEATDYTYFVDFSTKTVANFDDYDQMFYESTYDLNNTFQYTFNTYYRMNTCPPSQASDVYILLRYRVNSVGTYGQFLIELPDMPCTVSNTFYQITGSVELPDLVLNAVVNDDANFIEFLANFFVKNNAALGSRIITLTDTEFVYTFEYDFGTTYLFNYFLSDTKFNAVAPSSGVIITGAMDVDFDYVMTAAGNDRYFIINSDTTNYGNVRTKWAIDYNLEYFRGESIGSRYIVSYDTITIPQDATLYKGIGNQLLYYYLNAATANQAIVDAPEFNFDYEDCGWDVFNIPCFINNGLAYITNDAPIISDAITLLNAGIGMAAQTFGIIGAFTTDNVFGYLILAGFGFIAVRWFLKND